jgi:hypothetical protein
MGDPGENRGSTYLSNVGSDTNFWNILHGEKGTVSPVLNTNLTFMSWTPPSMVLKVIAVTFPFPFLKVAHQAN